MSTMITNTTRYKAIEVQPGLWMVLKIFSTHKGDYVESLIHIDTQYERVAIDAAIKRGSWA